MLKLSEENIELKFEAEQARKDVPRLKVGVKLDGILYGPRREKACLWGLANNTGADQPAHPRSLISAACASAQSDQRLCYSLFGKDYM